MYTERKKKENIGIKICFDMDGTIADLYGVENWFEYLTAENVKPYKIAKPLDFKIF